MQELTLKNFKGVNLDESRWAEAFSGYSVGMDINGLSPNASRIAYPGVLQPLLQVSAGVQAAGVSAVTELVTGFATYKGQDFAIGSANPGRIYRRDSATWAWVSAITVSAATAPAANLHVYGDNLYYTQQSYLGQYDNTNGNANFQSLAVGSTNRRIMKTLAGNLYVCHDRYVGKYDGTTWASAALTLPADFTIKSADVYGDRLYIMADNGQISRLFIWDGISTTYESYLDFPAETIAPSFQVAGGLLWLVGNGGGAQSPRLATAVYIFNGSSFDRVMSLPLGRTATTGLSEYKGGLLIGSGDGASASFEDGAAGVWLINQKDSGSPYYSILAFPTREQLTGKIIGSINPPYISCNDTTNSSFEIFEIQTGNASATNIWQSLQIDAGSTNKKIWHGVKLNADDLSGSNGITIKYRLDDDTSFTTLKSFTASTTAQMNSFIKLGKTSRTITLRVEITTSSGTGTRIHSLTVGYTPTQD